MFGPIIGMLFSTALFTQLLPFVFSWLNSNASVVALLISLISTILSLLAINQTHKNTFNATKGNPLLYIEHTHPKEAPQLILKNFGNSLVEVHKITLDPPFDISLYNLPIKDKQPLFIEGTPIMLPPNHQISSAFKYNKYPVKSFNVTIVYSTLGKKLTLTHKLTSEFYDKVLYIETKNS